MIFQSVIRKAAAGVILGLSGAVLLSGCGGATTSTQSFAKYTPNGPVVFGLNAVGALQASPPQYRETSGAGTTDLTDAYAVAAVASTALPSSTEVDSTTNTIPLGFGPGAQYINSATFGKAAHPGDQFIFGAYAANGLDGTGNFIDITNLTIASSDLGIASQAMTYAPKYTGPLANAQYKSGTLTVPAGATTGLKQLTVTVNDKAPSATNHSPSTTTFAMLVLAGSDSAVLAQITNTDSQGNVSAVPGAVATIDGANHSGYVGPGQTAPAAATSSVADTQGVVILFAPPGAHTITVTGSVVINKVNTPVSGTLKLTTTAGKLTNTVIGSDGNPTPVTIDLAPAAAS